MPTYRNVGSSLWRRPSDCTAVAPGATFEATEREHKALQSRPWMRKRIVLVDSVAEVAPKEDEVSTEDAAPDDKVSTQDEVSEDGASDDEVSEDEAPTQEEATLPAWDLAISPERYLELYPQGPRAVLARQLVEEQTPAPEE